METGRGDEVKLIGMWASPFVLRVKVALNLKGVHYESLEEDLPFGKSQLLLDSNPVHKKVPVLLHNGKPICESLIILEYIDEVWASAGAPAILPSDPYDRATARFWAAYVDEKIFASMKGALITESDEKRKALVESTLVGLGSMEEALDRRSKGGKFFGGESIGFLDLALGSLVGWLRVMGKACGMNFLDPDRTPRLAGWAESFCEADPIKDVLPDTDKLVEFRKTLQAAMEAASAAAAAAATPATPSTS
ncbi:Glutathione S-transferase U17 [Nymphaea thermarum]|nr:Glutathione S-transferase U17 [Nymphaea thermarum]